MNTRTCCRHAAQWVAPSIGLALVPKCPACLAAYVAALTGVGISMSVAARLRMGLLVLCAIFILIVAARQVSRLIQWHRKES
jgi:hypothetical protein